MLIRIVQENIAASTHALGVDINDDWAVMTSLFMGVRPAGDLTDE